MATTSKTHPTYLTGGTGCGFIWVADRDRYLWTWTMAGRQALGSSPVPGTGRILGADASRSTVILDTGEVFGWLSGRWVLLPPMEATNGTLRVRGVGTCGVATTVGDLNPGGVLELPVTEALRLLDRGRCVLETP